LFLYIFTSMTDRGGQKTEQKRETESD
jgi:hypothetical protein